MSFQDCINDLLLWGADDFVCLGWVVGITQEKGRARTPEEIKALSFQILREVVGKGLMEIGDLPERDSGQRPLQLKKWPGTVEEWLERVEREWVALGRLPNLGDICWLQNTVKGDEIGRLLLEAENQENCDKK